jgi:hypothetical protein
MNGKTVVRMNNGAVERYTVAQITRTMRREELRTAEGAVWALGVRDDKAARIRGRRRHERRLAGDIAAQLAYFAA